MDDSLPPKLQKLVAKLREDKLNSLTANQHKRQVAQVQRRLEAKERIKKIKADDSARKVEIINQQNDVSVTVTVNVEHDNKCKKVLPKSQPIKRKAKKEVQKQVKKKCKRANLSTDLQRKRTRERVQKHRARLSADS